MPTATNTKRSVWFFSLLLLLSFVALALVVEIASVHSRLMKMRTRAADPIRSVKLVQNATGKHELVGRRVLLSGVRVVKASRSGAFWIRTGEGSAPMLVVSAKERVRTATAENGADIAPGARLIVEGTLRKLPSANQGRRSGWRLPTAAPPLTHQLYVAAERLDRSDRLPSPIGPAET